MNEYELESRSRIWIWFPENIFSTRFLQLFKNKRVLDWTTVAPFDFWSRVVETLGVSEKARSPFEQVPFDWYPPGTMRGWMSRCDWLLVFHSRRRRDANVEARTRQRARRGAAFLLSVVYLGPWCTHAPTQIARVHARACRATIFISIDWNISVI